MERWGTRERVCAVELFIRKGSITEAQRGFRRERNQHEAPSPNVCNQAKTLCSPCIFSFQNSETVAKTQTCAS
jgi:hypothetical protein